MTIYNILAIAADYIQPHLTELFILSLIPVMAQIIAGMYLFQIFRIIGRKMTFYMVNNNVLKFILYAFISYTIYLAAQRPTQQPIEIMGLLIGFALPIGLSINTLFFQRDLARSMPSASPTTRRGTTTKTNRYNE